MSQAWSKSSVYCAGPVNEVRAFLRQLEEEDVFNRALDTNGVPYHSPVLQPLLPELTKCMLPALLPCSCLDHLAIAASQEALCVWSCGATDTITQPPFASKRHCLAGPVEFALYHIQHAPLVNERGPSQAGCWWVCRPAGGDA